MKKSLKPIMPMASSGMSFTAKGEILNSPISRFQGNRVEVPEYVRNTKRTMDKRG